MIEINRHKGTAGVRDFNIYVELFNITCCVDINSLTIGYLEN